MSADGGAVLRPRMRRLEGRRGAQHGDVVVAAADDLQPDREPRLREAARDGRRGLARHVEGVREDARRLAPDLHTADLGRIEIADAERRARDGRREQEVVALEELAGVLPPREPVEPRLDVLRRRHLLGFLDDREQTGVDLVAPVEVGCEPRADAAEEDGPPAVVGRRPRRVGALDAAAELAEAARGLRGGGAHLRVDRRRDAERLAPRHAKSLEASLERLHVVDARRRERILVAIVGHRAGVHHQRGVLHGSRHRPVMGETPRRARRVDGNPPPGGLEAEDAAPGGGLADRSAAVGAEGQGRQTRRDGGARAAGGAAGRVAEAPRVAGRAEEEVVGHADPAERRRVRLAEHDRAGRLHALDRGRVLGGHVVPVERRAESGPHVPGDDQVLHRERDAVERTELGAPPRDGVLRRLRGQARAVRVERDVRVQLLQRVDAREHRVDHLDGRDLFPGDGGGQIGGGHPAEVAVVHDGGYCMLPCLAMAAVAFGIFDHVDRSDEPIGVLYEQRLKLVEAAEAAGFRTYHVAEHHATRLGMAPSPGIFLAAVAQRTRRIRFGPLVYLLPLYTPLRLIEEIAMLDQMSGGRLELGVGRGISPYELAYCGVDFLEAPAMYAEALEVILAGLRGGRLTHRGRYYRYLDVPIELTPVQRPHPPLWQGVTSPEGAATAAARGVNIVGTAPNARMKEVVDRYFEAVAIQPG